MHPHRSESETRVSSSDGLRDQGRTHDRGQTSRLPVHFDPRSQVGRFEIIQNDGDKVIKKCCVVELSEAHAPQNAGDERAELRRYPHSDGNFTRFGATDETTALRAAGWIFGHGISPEPRPEPPAAQLLPVFDR